MLIKHYRYWVIIYLKVYRFELAFSIKSKIKLTQINWWCVQLGYLANECLIVLFFENFEKNSISVLVLALGCLIWRRYDWDCSAMSSWEPWSYLRRLISLLTCRSCAVFHYGNLRSCWPRSNASDDLFYQCAQSSRQSCYFSSIPIRLNIFGPSMMTLCAWLLISQKLISMFFA